MPPANCIGGKNHTFSQTIRYQSCSKRRLLRWFTCSNDKILPLALTDMRSHISWILKMFQSWSLQFKSWRSIWPFKKNHSSQVSFSNSKYYIWLQIKSSFSQQSYWTAIVMSLLQELWRTSNRWDPWPRDLPNNCCTSFSCLLPPSQTNSALQIARSISTSSHPHCSHPIPSHKQAEEHLEPGGPFETHSEANIRGVLKSKF